jgi:hypothetical protein
LLRCYRPHLAEPELGEKGGEALDTRLDNPHVVWLSALLVLGLDSRLEVE